MYTWQCGWLISSLFFVSLLDLCIGRLVQLVVWLVGRLVDLTVGQLAGQIKQFSFPKCDGLIDVLS